MQKAARDSVCSPSSPLFAALAAYAPLRGPCPCVPRRTGPLLSGPSLHAHSLHNNSISADGAKAVANALPRCVALTRLYLGGYFDSDNIGPDGAEAVAAVLPLTKSLQLLECVSLGLLARPPRHRAPRAPPGHPRHRPQTGLALFLHSLRNNDLGDLGAKAIADALPLCTTLDELQYGPDLSAPPGPVAAINRP